MPHQEPPDTEYSYDHNVTYANTVKHWVLYTLDGIEADGAADPANDPADGSVNITRAEGVSPADIYQYAAGDDSIVFRNKQEVGNALSEMARLAPYFENENRPVNRRTYETDWDGPDTMYHYRLTDHGRQVLLDLGVPTKLPNRRDFDEEDRALGVMPAHQPGWWLEEYDLFSDEWDIRRNDWHPTDHKRVYYKEETDALFENRGYGKIGEKLAELFPDVTFVLSVGPHRPHDMMYAIRDPWRKVVQIDVYSPMTQFRTTEQMKESFEALVTDLRKGLSHATGEADD